MKKKYSPNKIYPYNEVLKECLTYFNGDELAATTWINKYASRNNKEELLEITPDAMHMRMAAEFARIEKKFFRKKINKKFFSVYGQKRKPLTKERIFKYFEAFKYIIPQGSVMASLGNKNVIASYSNCVVLPKIFDSYGGILYTDQQLAQLFKRRCGVGIDISSLRPEGNPVSNAARTTSGAVSFMERYSNTTREVAQKGRRGALMITMDIAYPDIEKFVTVKQDLTKITGANISVRLSDEFMQAVDKDSIFTLRWPVDSKQPKIKKTVKARDLWQTIVRCAHNTAEPGLIFWDKQHNYSTSSIYPGYENVSTNPCSEIAMQGGDSCRLIAINLYSLIEQPFTPQAKFNYEKFYEVVYEAQRLMDDLVDLELEAIERILKKTESDPEPTYIKQIELQTWKLLYETGKKGRRTGLGFTALGDAIAALGHSFDSKKVLIEVEKIMKTKCEAEFESSIDLAIERGKFKAFDPRIESKSRFVQMLKKELPHVYKRLLKYGRRNISISTVAPTGSLSILTQTSSGIEPVYMLSYKRRRKINANDKNTKVDFVDQLGDAWQEFTVYHPKLKQWMEISGQTDISKSPYHGSTASEIDWVRRIELQAVVQKYVTHSISSTINLPSNVSIEQVGAIYMEAWKRGLKGITVYRDGARSGVLIAESQRAGIVETPARPKILESEVVRFTNFDEQWVAVVGLMNERPYEIFTGKEDGQFFIPATIEKGWVVKHKSGSVSRYDFNYTDENGQTKTVEGLSRAFNQEYWNYAKLISGVLRHGMPLTQVIDLVENLKLYSDNINTWKSGVTRALKRYVKDGAVPADRQCPSCGDTDGLIYEEGCLKCKSCGYSLC
ncbi:MAG: adenosylcobalamin-dependent ribonucleoside-diphosphate reductase [Bacteroidetes bacterium]|nr:adenosylcobalamin-dependent ribonucleoside-diphosphate reductase [Bacteroidota bacterium]